MRQIIDQIVSLLRQGIEAIFRFVDLVWQWSFGEMFQIFQSNWQALPLWKIVVLGIAVIAIVYVLYRGFFQLWRAAEQIFRAFVELLMVLVSVLPFVLLAGLIAAAGSYVIQHVNF